MPWTGWTPPVLKSVVCRGSYGIGSACGRCLRCERELGEMINKLVGDNPCVYDGEWCQTHHHWRPCPHEQAKKILVKISERGNQ